MAILKLAKIDSSNIINNTSMSTNVSPIFTKDIAKVVYCGTHLYIYPNWHLRNAKYFVYLHQLARQFPANNKEKKQILLAKFVII